MSTVAAGASSTHSAIAVYERYPATTAQTAALTTTGSRCRTPRRARGSGRRANAAGNPAALASKAPAGTHDSAEISDDGDAGMAHFGQITRRRNLDDLRNGHARPAALSK